MFPSHLVKYWYIFLTIIILLAPLKINVFEFIIGLILMWLLFYVYRNGVIRNNSILNKSIIILRTSKDTSKISLIISIIFTFYIPFYVFFYTGNSIVDIYNAFFGVNTNYNNYQIFFQENNLSTFSINKLPYIFSFALIKFCASLSIINIISFQKNRKIIDYISLLLIFCSFVYSSVGRGTSFELFELSTLLIYSFFLNIQLKGESIKIPTKNIIQITCLSLIALIYFIINISKRYGVESIIESDFEFINCATNEFCVDKSSQLFKFSPAVAITLFQVANYFDFGIFFVSKLIEGIVFNSIGGFVSIFIPYGSYLFFENSYKNLVCSVIIDCGYDWIPDIIMLLTNLGLIGTFIIVYYLGIFSNTVFKESIKGSLFSSMLLFYIITFIISLPSGNYITSSSSNQLCVLFSLLLYISPIEKKYFQKFIDNNLNS